MHHESRLLHTEMGGGQLSAKVWNIVKQSELLQLNNAERPGKPMPTGPL